MTISKIKKLADSKGIKLSVRDGKVVLAGRMVQVDELQILVRRWKPELIQVLQGLTVGDVGICDCGSALLGLPTFDGFVNRVCPDCGRWLRCLNRHHDWAYATQDITEKDGAEKDRAENSKFALLPPNDINKGGCRVLEHPTA